MKETKNRHKGLIITFSGVGGLILLTLLAFIFGNPQWNKYIYMIHNSGFFGLFPRGYLIKKPHKSNYTGLWRDWDRHGNKIYEGHYKNGIEQGKHVSYFLHGKQIRSEKNYLNGFLHGKSVNYHLNGEIDSEWDHINGRLQTLQTYYENGQKNLYVPYRNGKKHGVCRKWNEIGKTLYERNYENGNEILIPENIKLNKDAHPLKVLLDKKHINDLFRDQKYLNNPFENREKPLDKDQVIELLGPPPWQYSEKHGCSRFKYFQKAEGENRELVLFFLPTEELESRVLHITSSDGKKSSSTYIRSR